MLSLYSSSANKIQIKSAVENKFNVSVLKGATMNFDGKIKQMTTKSNGRTIRTQGRKSSFKKAVVTLSDGDIVDYLNSGGEVNMGVRYLKPVTPGSRFASRSDFSEITTVNQKNHLL